MLSDDFDECLERIGYWWRKLQDYRAKKGGYNVLLHAQPYRDPNKKNTPPQWQKDLASWCNKRMIFAVSSFDDYEPRKGFRCSEYIEQRKREKR